MEGRAAARLGRRDERGEQLPLGIGQVGRIAATGWGHRTSCRTGSGQPRILRAFQTPFKGHRALCPFARTIAVASLTIARWPFEVSNYLIGPTTYTTRWDATPSGSIVCLFLL
jgi:hypothetical protein